MAEQWVARLVSAMVAKSAVCSVYKKAGATAEHWVHLKAVTKAAYWAYSMAALTAAHLVLMKVVKSAAR